MSGRAEDGGVKAEEGNVVAKDKSGVFLLSETPLVRVFRDR